MFSYLWIWKRELLSVVYYVHHSARYARSDKLREVSPKLPRLILKRRNVSNLRRSVGLLFRQLLCRKESPIMTIIPLEGTRLWKYWSSASSDTSALTNTNSVMSASSPRSQTTASTKLLITQDAFVWYVISDNWCFFLDMYISWSYKCSHVYSDKSCTLLHNNMLYYML